MAEKFSEEHYHAVYAPVLLMTHYGLLFSVVFSLIKKKKSWMKPQDNVFLARFNTHHLLSIKMDNWM